MGPVTRSSLPQRQRQESPPKRRLLPPAPGKAAGYNPQPEHQAQTEFQPAVTYLITPSYVPDNAVMAPPTAEDPPRTEPDEPTDPIPSDTDSNDTEGEGFLTSCRCEDPFSFCVIRVGVGWDGISRFIWLSHLPHHPQLCTGQCSHSTAHGRGPPTN